MEKHLIHSALSDQMSRLQGPKWTIRKLAMVVALGFAGLATPALADCERQLTNGTDQAYDYMFASKSGTGAPIAPDHEFRIYEQGTLQPGESTTLALRSADAPIWLHIFETGQFTAGDSIGDVEPEIQARVRQRHIDRCEMPGSIGIWCGNIPSAGHVTLLEKTKNCRP